MDKPSYELVGYMKQERSDLGILGFVGFHFIEIFHKIP